MHQTPRPRRRNGRGRTQIVLQSPQRKLHFNVRIKRITRFPSNKHHDQNQPNHNANVVMNHSSVMGWLYVCLPLDVILITRRFEYKSVVYTENDDWVVFGSRRRQTVILESCEHGDVFIHTEGGIFCTEWCSLADQLRLLPMSQVFGRDLVSVIASFLVSEYPYGTPVLKI